MWNRITNYDEMIELELSDAERKLLLTGIIYLPNRVEAAIRSTPPGKPVNISVGDLDNMAGQLAGEANHAKFARAGEIMRGLFDKVEELVSIYARG